MFERASTRSQCCMLPAIFAAPYVCVAADAAKRCALIRARALRGHKTRKRFANRARPMAPARVMLFYRAVDMPRDLPDGRHRGYADAC